MQYASDCTHVERQQCEDVMRCEHEEEPVRISRESVVVRTCEGSVSPKLYKNMKEFRNNGHKRTVKTRN